MRHGNCLFAILLGYHITSRDGRSSYRLTPGERVRRSHPAALAGLARLVGRRMARNRASYDPWTQQPETMLELERWYHVSGASQHELTIRPPIPLGPECAVAVDRLLAYSMSEFGEMLSTGPIRRMIGRYAKDAGASIAQAEATALQEAADFLAPSRPAPRRTRRTAKRASPKKAKKPVKKVLKRPVELRGRANPPVVRGRQKNYLLTAPQYDVIGVLLTAGEKGLTKDELASLSKHADARGILRRLANSDSDWQAVIKFPGKPGVRYRIG